MKRLARLALTVFLLNLAAFGQSLYSGVAQTATGQALAGVSVDICSLSPGTTTPCTSIITTFTDITLGTACTAYPSVTAVEGPTAGTGCTYPGLTDGYGNFTLYGNPGTVWNQIYGYGITTPYVKQIIFPASGTGVAAGNQGNPQYRSNTGSFAANTTTITVDSTWAGADGGAKITTAEAALPSTGGTIDTSGFGCTQQTISTQLTIGADLKPVKWIKPACQQWLDKVTGGVTAIRLADSSSIGNIGGAPSSAFSNGLSDILIDPSANNDCVIGPLHTVIPAVQEQMTVDALMITGQSGATISKGLVCVIALGTNTRISNVYTQFANAASALYIGQGANDVNFYNNNWDCTATCSGPAVNIVATASGQILGINFFGDKFQHAGNGQSLLVMDGHLFSTSGVQSVACWGCGFENVATAPTDSVQLIDTLNVSINSPIVTGATTTNFVHLLTHYGMFTLRDFNSLPNTIAVLDGLTGETTTGNYIPLWQSRGDLAAAGAAASRVGNFYSPGSSFSTLSDSSGTITWAVGNTQIASAFVTFTSHAGNRTLNVSGLFDGGSYQAFFQQDATGGEGILLPLGNCAGGNFYVVNGGAGVVTLTNAAAAIDSIEFTYHAGFGCFITALKNFTHQ